MSNLICAAASWVGVELDRCQPTTDKSKAEKPKPAVARYDDPQARYFLEELLFGTSTGGGAVGCKSGEKEKLRKVKIPLWSKEQLAKAKEKRGLEYATKLMKKPPFYKGQMPLELISHESFPGMFGSRTIYAHKFEGLFTNIFIYKSGELEGAVTINNQGKVIAEARVEYFILEDKEGMPSQGRKLEEFHYDENGQLIFTCKSEIDSGNGFKIKESDKVGEKQRDYYFIWPQE